MDRRSIAQNFYERAQSRPSLSFRSVTCRSESCSSSRPSPLQPRSRSSCQSRRGWARVVRLSSVIGTHSRIRYTCRAITFLPRFDKPLKIRVPRASVGKPLGRNETGRKGRMTRPLVRIGPFLDPSRIFPVFFPRPHSLELSLPRSSTPDSDPSLVTRQYSSRQRSTLPEIVQGSIETDQVGFEF